jgi:hypothetical protein
MDERVKRISARMDEIGKLTKREEILPNVDTLRKLVEEVPVHLFPEGLLHRCALLIWNLAVSRMPSSDASSVATQGLIKVFK